MPTFETGSSRANHSGLPKRQMQLAEETLGPPPSSTRSDISFNMQASPSMSVKVIMHNTLASSDYGLLDENTFAPRPNYWAALLWRRLMGTTVLDPQISPAPNVYVYAHCLQNHPKGVALLVVNADQRNAHELTLPAGSRRYTLSAKQLQDTTVQLNGHTLGLNSNGDVPLLAGEPTRAGRLGFAPASITFLAIPDANNSSCR